MPEIGFGIPSKGSLLEALAAIPPDYQGYLRGGFGRLSTLDASKRTALLSTVRQAAPYPSNIELEPIAAMLGLNSTESSSVVSACRLLLGALSFRSDSPKEFVDAAIQAGILDSKDSPAIGEFAEVIASKRAEFRRNLTTSSLQHELLPSLARVDFKIDVRVEFQGGKLTAVAPVALVYIDTDSDSRDIWFQMTRPQLLALEAKLKQASEELARAEEVAQKLL